MISGRRGGSRPTEDARVVAQTSPPPRLPTSSELLAWLASAFRLVGLVRGGSDDFSAATVKRIGAGDPRVSDARHGSLLRQTVGALFTEEHLSGSGIGDPTIHQRIVLRALEALLESWDQLAATINAGPAFVRAPLLWGVSGLHLDEESTRFGLITMLFNMYPWWVDVAARAGAYMAHHRRVLPFLFRAGAWSTSPGISGAWADILSRCSSRPSEGELLRISSLSRNTYRAIRDGRRIPNEESLLKLAMAATSALAGTGANKPKRAGKKRPNAPGDHRKVVPPLESRSRIAPAIEAELRWASALAEVRQLLSDDPAFLRTAPLFSSLFEFFANDLRRYPETEGAECVEQGVNWPRWREVHLRLCAMLFQEHALPMLSAIERRMSRAMSSALELSVTDPKAALLRVAEFEEELARRLEFRESADAPNHPLAVEYQRAFLHSAASLRALAEEKPAPAHPDSGDALKALSLCFEAIAPWNNLTGDEKRTLYETAVATHPSLPAVRRQTAVFAATTCGDLAQAILHLRAALAINPGDLEAKESLTAYLLQAGRSSEALEVADELTKEAPSSRVHVLRSCILISLDRLQEAQEILSGVLELEPQCADAHRMMAEIAKRKVDARLAARHDQAARLYGGQRPPRTQD